MSGRFIAVTGAFVTACFAVPAHADPCEAPVPSQVGVEFSGLVRYVGDGDGLCVGRTSDPNEWIEVRLADFDAPELHTPGGPAAKAALRAAIGAPTITTPSGATLARKHVYAWSSTASTFSLATIVGREMTDGNVDHDVYTGGQVTEFKMAQGLGPDGGGVTSDTLATCEFAVDYAAVDRAKAANGSTAYPDPLLAFGLGECTLSLGPDLGDLDPECLNKFEATFPTGLDLANRCISGSLAREKATRGEIPKPTLSLGRRYKSRALYDAFLDGAVMAFRAEWVGPTEIETGFPPSVRLDIPAIRLTGSTPQMSEDAATTQDLPAEVLWNGTDPLATLTLVTTDTAV